MPRGSGTGRARGAGLAAALVLLAAACRPLLPINPSPAELPSLPLGPEERARPWRPLALRESRGWERLSLPAESTAPVHQVMAVPDRAAGRPLVAVVGQRVYRSVDAGGQWERWPLAIEALATGAPLDLVYSPTYAYDRTVFARIGAAGVEGAGVYRSDDGGTTWEGVLAVPVRQVVISPTFVIDRTLLAVGAGGGTETWLSRDRGATWTRLASLGQHWFSPSHARDGVLLSVRVGRLLRQRGADTPWVGVLDEARIRGVVFSPRYPTDSTVFAYGDGVYRSTTAGLRWAAIGPELEPDDRVEALAVAPDGWSLRTLLAVVARTGDGGPRYQIVRSLDDGQTWGPTAGEWSPEDGPEQPVFAPNTPGRVYLPTARGLWVSEDYGHTWRDLTPPTTGADIAPRVRGMALATGRAGLLEVCFLATGEGLWRLIKLAAPQQEE